MTLLYFAWVRQKLGAGEETLELPSEVRTVGQLAEHLRARGGPFEDVFADRGAIRAAVNQLHVDWNASIQVDDEVAFFPPVTGG